jgi:hypothetical protein
LNLVVDEADWVISAFADIVVYLQRKSFW